VCGMKTKDLLGEREKTHGSFYQNANIAQTIRWLFREQIGWQTASMRQREALDQIATKLSRILSGQPDFADHWKDIAGYAELAANEERPTPSPGTATYL
jgi:Domain of unknown function (DUF6378)